MENSIKELYEYTGKLVAEFVRLEETNMPHLTRLAIHTHQVCSLCPVKSKGVLDKINLSGYSSYIEGMTIREIAEIMLKQIEAKLKNDKKFRNIVTPLFEYKLKSLLEKAKAEGIADNPISEIKKNTYE